MAAQFLVYRALVESVFSKPHAMHTHQKQEPHSINNTSLPLVFVDANLKRNGVVPSCFTQPSLPTSEPGPEHFDDLDFPDEFLFRDTICSTAIHQRKQMQRTKLMSHMHVPTPPRETITIDLTRVLTRQQPRDRQQQKQDEDASLLSDASSLSSISDQSDADPSDSELSAVSYLSSSEEDTVSLPGAHEKERTLASKTVQRTKRIPSRTGTTATRPLSFLCHECGISFKRPQDLRRHAVHGHEKDKLADVIENRKCGLCGIIFSRRDAMLRHARLRRCTK
ncbi:hypothetical protein HDU98_010647 [Podochytrium sp. JEL0797]|nr:hypothetical protein HDU98_010647 [Podochytrium sp. JEL0797]